MAVNKKSAVREDNVKNAVEAEASGDKYVTFTHEIQGEDVEITMLRDPMDAPREILNYLSRKDPSSLGRVVELLMGSERLAEIDKLGPTGNDFVGLFGSWAEAVDVASK